MPQRHGEPPAMDGTRGFTRRAAKAAAGSKERNEDEGRRSIGVMIRDWEGERLEPTGAGDHARGPEDAPVTLVKYGDYECPHCGRAHPLLKELRERTGERVRFVFRHFPLDSVHPRSRRAAQAAEAAAAQDRFWEMHDLLYEGQDDLGEEALMRYAAE